MHRHRRRRSESRLQVAFMLALFALAPVFPSLARDILRPNQGAPGSSSAATAASSGSVSANVSAAGLNAQEALARTTQALQALQNMQTSARNLAKGAASLGLNPNHPGQLLPVVPNGLVTGGLQVAPGASAHSSLWEGATLPKQSGPATQPSVTIDQTQPQALLTWQTFNIGKNTTVNFDQSAGTQKDGSNNWLVINEILDPSGVPSQILGAMHAQGTVYLLDQNGILFGGSSQLNLHSLVASSLPINTNLVSRGLLNDPDDQFLFSALPIPVLSSGTMPAFNPTLTGQAFTQPGVALTPPSHTLAKPVETGTTPTVSAGGQTLTAGVDYTIVSTKSGKTTVTLTLTGLAAAAGNPVSIAYETVVHGSAVPVTDSSFTPALPSFTLAHLVATGSAPVLTAGASGSAPVTLIAGSDYNLSQNSLGETVVTFTASGLQKLASSTGAPLPLTVAYSAAIIGPVEVEAGAQISSPTNASNLGGAVALVAPTVINAGTISTPNGQTILAAGDQVQFAAHLSSDASLRGFDVSIGAVDQGSGTATNSGVIEAARADVTIAGKTVNQLGGIDGSTSVTLNGRIDLLASYDTVREINLGAPIFAPTASGTVTLGAGSVTQILPELASTETVVGTQLALPSQINFQGRAIYLAPDAQVLAPNANVTLSAGSWYQSSSGATFIPNVGQIYLDAGASINVAGSIVSAPVSQNIISAQLLGPELADSPLQRDGILRGQTIEIDIRDTGVYDGQYWVGTPLANVSGYVGVIQYPVGELTAAGGAVTLSAGGSVVMQPTSIINVSGGAINYQGGMVQTTRLVSDGIIYDISQATPDLVYQGIYTGQFVVSHPKYNISATFTNPLLLSGAHYEQSYTQGGSGGSITIDAPSVALDGTVLGQTFAGPRQRQVPPALSSFSLSFQQQTAAGTGNSSLISPTPPDVIFQANADQAAADPFALDASGNPLALRKDRQALVILSPNLLTTDGFGSLTVNNSDGNITVPARTALSAPAFGSITLSAANLDIEGSVSAPGGALSFTVYDFSPYAAARYPTGNNPPPANPSRGQFTLGAAGSLSAAGLIVDDRPGAPLAETLPLAVNGGSITINSFSASLALGGAIDVSGGVEVNPAGAITYGKGGSISLSAGEDPNGLETLGGRLSLNSILTGYSGAAGGSLSIVAPLIQIGGATSNPNTLLLAPDFFSQGGFASFSLTGLGETMASTQLPAISIAPGTVIAPIAENWLAEVHSPGDGVTLKPMVLPEAQRTPVSLAFAAPGVVTGNSSLLERGDFVMGDGASITTDALGRVSINAQTVTVLGSIVAPGGAISINGAGGNQNVVTQIFPAEKAPAALATIYLGPDASLSTAGTTVLTPDVYGDLTGSVLAGGSISISGNIVAAAGSKLNVSGASGVLSLPQSETTLAAPVVGSFFGAPVVPIRIDSNGGSITLAGQQELFTDATLIGAAGGPTAIGGSLTVSSGRYVVGAALNALAPTDPTLVITQGGLTIPVAFSTNPIGQPLLGANGKVLSPAGEGHLAVDSFNTGGFNAITLSGTVQFSSQVSITAAGTLTVADGGVIIANGPVSLSAPHVVLGLPFQPPLAPGPAESPFNTAFPGISGFNPTYGPGSLTVTAQLIDLGNLSLQNIGQAAFIAPNGDIRGDGTLDVAGRISLTAGQIYPATDVVFTIAASDYLDHGKTEPGSVIIASSGSRALPLSAGGTLNIYGAIIDQGGVLRAPIGTINLGWDGAAGTAPIDLITNAPVASTSELTLRAGSITSVSAVDPSTGQGLLIPYGSNPTGSAWLDPAGINITSGGVPGKTITVAGARIDDQAGSVIDLSGGGDLYAYRFVSGEGGSTDILGSASAGWSGGVTYAPGQIVSYQGSTWVAVQTNLNAAPSIDPYWRQIPTSYAVIPGYQAGFAPYAPFNNTVSAYAQSGSAVGDPGYISASLPAGEQVYLGAGSGLHAGIYTLLPARYALLPGAFLLTPSTAAPVGAQTLPDGSSLVAGYLFNGFSNPGGTGQSLVSQFEVQSQSVVLTRAQYDGFLASSFLYQGAVQNQAAIPRLPIDAGQLIFQASSALAIHGTVDAQAPGGGQGGLVDISSPADIYITSAGKTGPAGSLMLDASELSSFGAESLLIGGIRTFGASGTTVTVETNNIEVNNSGSPLTGPDVILVANDKLKLDPGASISASGALIGGAEPLLLDGGGALLRVSSDSTSSITRSDVTSSTSPDLIIGAGAQISGAGVILDSTYATSLAYSAVIQGQSIALDSGQISLQLTNPGSLPSSNDGLVLNSAALSGLERGTQSLSLLSYSSIDVYGSGTVGNASLGLLALHAGEIRGFGGGDVTFSAGAITLDNSANAAPLEALTPPGAPLTGTLAFSAETMTLGANQLAILNDNVVLSAAGGLLLLGSGGLSAQGNFTINHTPLVTGASGASHSITALGALTINAAKGSPSVSGGLGASLTLVGSNIVENGAITLASGSIALDATGAASGDGISVGGSLNVAGTAQAFFDLVKYTDAGQISLTANQGSIQLTAASVVNVSAAGGGNAGSLSISAPNGQFSIDPAAQLLGKGGAGGSFSLDASTIPATGTAGIAGSVGAIDATLAKGGFTDSISIRDRIDAVVTVNNVGTQGAIANSYSLSADQGSIDVTGTIDAAGATGGAITLAASGSVTLESGALLTVAAQTFSAAGKGGAVTLDAGSETNGVVGHGSVNILTGSKIDLSVASNTTASAAAGDFTGTLHLRAPQTNGGADLQVHEIDGAIVGASSILVEGYALYTAANGSIDDQESAIMSNGMAFAANTAAIAARLLNGQSTATAAALLPSLVIAPGAEIINPNGNLTLANNWDLSTYRFSPDGGPNGVPGVLTLRASGDLIFHGALSDGFTSAAYTATLLAQNTALPVNTQSWSYQLTAGADFTAADASRVIAGTGSLLLGVNDGSADSASPGLGVNATTAKVIAGHYQVIRTGSGDISISTGGNVELLNQFATIYTAGTQVLNPTLNGTFSIPVIDESAAKSNSGSLGSTQESPSYPAQYSEAGGNVVIHAAGSIEHLTQNANGVLVMDSESELPNNWLYRRGYVDAAGVFGSNSQIKGQIGGEPSESTTWWIDFSNFFEGVGALGGGNVTMIAGQDIANVDAVVPTNARMPGIGPNGNLAPNAASLVELGGGNLLVRAGHDINGGVYYVERGQGVLSAGDQILTNSTRAPVGGASSTSGGFSAPPQAWLPTTLFLGDGSFNVSAGSNVLLGPVANPFLLPEGLSNSVWYKTYFSTYAASDAVNVSSLSGSVTFREDGITSGGASLGPLLYLWLGNMDSVNPLVSGGQSRADYQPWLRLNEAGVLPFLDVSNLMPPALNATAFSGSINIVGDLLLAPSPTGTVNLAARGSINGFQSEGTAGSTTYVTAAIDLSDSNPSLLPGVASPFAFQGVPGVGTSAVAAGQAGPSNLLGFISDLFDATSTGATGVLQTEEALHAPNLLHGSDAAPVRLYAAGGEISGVTLYSPKETRVIATGDITDIDLVMQNDDASAISVVSAGGNILAYDPSSPARLAAQANPDAAVSIPADLSGDIKIAGPGTLEVLAGRNLELGGPGAGGATNSTDDGIASIGNTQNPNLPFAGADLVAAAGIGLAPGLDQSRLGFAPFIAQFISSSAGARYLGELSSLVDSSTPITSASITALPPAEQDLLALDLFFLVLRDAGRDHNDPTAAGYGTYTAGFAAISALFPNAGQGDIDVTARDLKTESGGNISLLAPGGQVTVGLNATQGGDVTNLGIVTQDGGNISIFAKGDVNVGTSRIFTLRGGNEIIWSSTGDIDAGASSKTVQSAPPTRVIVDPESGNVQTDLAGLATGGGIGVLATVVGVPPGNVDLIAPVGTVNAGDAGIRVTGNLNIAAAVVLNAGNIQVAGASTGVPAAPVVAAPNLGGFAAGSAAGGAAASAAAQVANQTRNQSEDDDIPSIITVEVVGYGGGEGPDE